MYFFNFKTNKEGTHGAVRTLQLGEIVLHTSTLQMVHYHKLKVR